MDSNSKEFHALAAEEMACLRVLKQETRPEGRLCLSFAPVMRRTNLDRRSVRASIRSLAEKGLAQFWRGLFNECTGEPAGAGYCITDAGVSWLRDNETQGEGIKQVFAVRDFNFTELTALMVLGHDIDPHQPDMKSKLTDFLTQEMAECNTPETISSAVEVISSHFKAEMLFARGAVLHEDGGRFTGQVEYFSLLNDPPTVPRCMVTNLFCGPQDHYSLPVTAITWPNDVHRRFQLLMCRKT